MDDLLVIILTLIVAVVGALGQIKKKKPGQENNQPEEKTDDFWSFIEGEEEVDEQPNEDVETQMQPQPQPQASMQSFSEDLKRSEERRKKPEYKFNVENEGKSIYQHDLTADQTTEQETPKKESKKKIRDFSLRKAVIYSEILNRKYD